MITDLGKPSCSSECRSDIEYHSGWCSRYSPVVPKLGVLLDDEPKHEVYRPSLRSLPCLNMVSTTS